MGGIISAPVPGTCPCPVTILSQRKVLIKETNPRPNLHRQLCSLVPKLPSSYRQRKPLLTRQGPQNKLEKVVFGVSSSPFLLNATVKHHIERYEEEDPDFVETFLRSIYVDDLSTGGDTDEVAYQL